MLQRRSMNLDNFVRKFSGVTEKYTFYNNTIEILYDLNNHLYLLITPTGLEELPSVSTVCHIIDKSEILVPWSAKVMEQKLLATSGPFYRFDGYHFSSEQLEKWIKEGKKAHKEHLEDAGNIGKIAHAWIEQSIKDLLGDPELINAKPLPEETRASSAVTASLDFINDHNIRWIATEFKICSLEDKFAGTCDGRCLADSCKDPKCCPQEFKDQLCIIDWKTSNQLNIEYKLQVAAYRKAFEEETGQKIDHAFIIRLGKTDGKFQTWHLNKEDLDESWFAFKDALGLYKRIKLLKNKTKKKKNNS